MRDFRIPPSARVTQSKKNLEDGTDNLSRNVGMKQPFYAA